MVCTVLPPSARAARSVRSLFTTPLVRAGGTPVVVVVRGHADSSTNAAGKPAIEEAVTEFVDTATVSTTSAQFHFDY
jgi:hypothetical protein